MRSRCLRGIVADADQIAQRGIVGDQELMTQRVIVGDQELINPDLQLRERDALRILLADRELLSLQSSGAQER